MQFTDLNMQKYRVLKKKRTTSGTFSAKFENFENFSLDSTFLGYKKIETHRRGNSSQSNQVNGLAQFNPPWQLTKIPRKDR